MSRNFSLGSRNMTDAGRNALQAAQSRGEISFSTVATVTERFEHFNQFAKAAGVGKFERVDQALVTTYGQQLAERVEAGQLRASYAQNLVSAVNTVMRTASETVGRSWASVSPTKDCGIASRDNVRTDAPASLDRAVADRAIQAAREVDPRAGTVADLARELGLRSKEGALLDARSALAQAESSGLVTIEYGTKGGQDRTLEVSERGLAALARAAEIQGTERSVMGSQESWKDFREGALRDGREAMQAYGLTGFHDCRAAYACERYQDITGHSAPCVTGERTASSEIDREARGQISEELGHHREDVVAAYIGGR